MRLRTRDVVSPALSHISMWMPQNMRRRWRISPAAERGLGDWSGAITHLEGALGLYARVGDLRAIGRIVFETVETFIWTGHFDDAAQIVGGLSHLRGDESTYRARLMAALGWIHAVRSEFSDAMEAFDEALASPAVTPFLARVLGYRSFCHLYLLELEEALEVSRQSVSLSNPHDSPWTHALSLSLVMRSLYHLGKPDQALKIAMDLEPLARGVGQLGALSFSISIKAWAEFAREPNLKLLDQRICDTVTFHRGAQLSWFLGQSLVQMSLVRFFAGDWGSAWAIAEEAGAAELSAVFGGLGTGMLLRLAAYAGDREKVLELVGQAQSQLSITGKPNAIGSWLLLMDTVEAFAIIGERDRAALLYPVVHELLRCGALSISFPYRLLETR